MESLKKYTHTPYTYTIHNVYTGLFGEKRSRNSIKYKKTAVQPQSE